MARNSHKKLVLEIQINDTGLHCERYPQYWEILADKGYQGLLEVLRAILSIKWSPGRTLSMADKVFNRNVSSDHITVENYFGRLNKLWTLQGTKWRWAESLYDDVFCIGVALINFYIKINPLRAEDHQVFSQNRNRLAHIAHQVAEKNRQTLLCYKDRSRARVNQQFRLNQFASTGES